MTLVTTLTAIAVAFIISILFGICYYPSPQKIEVWAKHSGGRPQSPSEKSGYANDGRAYFHQFNYHFNACPFIHI